MGGVTWNGPGVVSGPGFNPFSAGPGTHTITVTSAAGCFSTMQVVVNPTPVLVLKTSAPVCSPQTVNLYNLIDPSSVLPPGTALNFYDNSNAAAVNDPSHVSASGTYRIIASLGSCNDQQLVTVTVNPTPVPAPFSPFCSSSNGYNPLALINTMGGVTWNGPGVVSGPGFNPFSAGPGTHTITVTSAAGCFSSMQVVVNPTPVLVLKTPAPLCSPATVNLTSLIDQAASTLPSGTVFQYYYGSNSSGTVVTTPSAVGVASSAAVTYTIKATTPSGCTTAASVVVSIYLSPTFPSTFTNTSFCSNDNNPVALGTNFTGSLPLWSGPGVTTVDAGTARSYYFDPTVAPIGVNTLTMINVNNAACNATVQMTVNPTPVLVLKTPAPLCSPATVNLTSLIDQAASTLPSGTVFQYYYGSNSSGTVVTTPSAVGVASSAAVTYTIKATTPSGCTTAASVVVSIYLSPTLPTFTNTSFCSNDNNPVALGTNFTGSLPLWSGPGDNSRCRDRQKLLLRSHSGTDWCEYPYHDQCQ